MSMEGDGWSLRAALERCGGARPPAYAGLSADTHLNSFDVGAGGGAALLGADGRLYLTQLFQPSGKGGGRAPLLAHVALDPPLSKEEAAAVEIVQLNASGSHALLVARTWVKAAALPAAARGLLYPASSASVQRGGAADAATERFLVRLTDGTEQELSLPTGDASDELERVQRAMGRRQVASVSRQLGVASVRPVGGFPGVRQAAWHPLSDAHVVVLSDADELALFDLRADGPQPEQRHLLDFPPATDGKSAVTTAFAFGQQIQQTFSNRWDSFTCYLLRSDGSVFALCPLVPYGCRVGRALLQSLRAEVDAQILRCKQQPGAGDRVQARVAELKSHKYWLQEAWAPATGPDNAGNATDLFRFLPPRASGISPETWPLAVQGPVDVTPKSVVAGKHSVAGGASAASLLVVPPPPRVNGAAPLLVRSYTSGHLELMLLDAPVRPRWKSDLRVKRGGDSLPALLLECLSLGVDDSAGKAALAGDPADARLVYCLHSTGVHVLNVGWALSLVAGKQFTTLPKSSVRHIFSVSPTSSAVATVSNVVGARVAKSVDVGHLLLLRLASGSFEVINVSAASTDLHKGGQLDGDSDGRATNTSASSASASASASASGLRPFADVVEEKLDVLNPRGTRVTGKTPLREVDAAVLAFAVDRVKILYEDVEYVDAMGQLVRDRLLVHRDMVAAQTAKAAAVRSNVDAAKLALKGLQSKMERALAVQHNLAKRAAAVLQAVKENQPSLSRAERELKSELERLAIDVRRLQPQVTQLTVSGQRLVRSLDAAGRQPRALDSSLGGGGAVLTDDKKRMCYDVLRAETQLIDDSKSLLEELTAGLQQLRT